MKQLRLPVVLSLFGAIALMSAVPAQARTHWSLNIGIGGFGYYPAPVYVAPRVYYPAYAPAYAPVYPAPVYASPDYAPAYVPAYPPVYAPVYQQPQVIYREPVVIHDRPPVRYYEPVPPNGYSYSRSYREYRDYRR